MNLYLSDEISKKETKKFLIQNEIEIKDFHGYQYKLPFCAVKKRNGVFIFDEYYSQTLINNHIKPNEALSFIELHRSNFTKEKHYESGRFTTVYYAVYTIREIHFDYNNSYNNFESNNATIEIVFKEGPFNRIENLYLKLEPFTPILYAVQSVFSNENLEALPSIKVGEDGLYHITYYTDKGREKDYVYNDINSIFTKIISVKLIKSERVDEECAQNVATANMSETNTVSLSQTN